MYRFIFLITILIYSINATSQISSDWDIGIMAGGSNYVGDINSMFNKTDNTHEWNQFESSFNLYNVHFMGGLLVRYNLNPRWSFRGSLLLSKLSGDDKHFSNPRNLNFHSNIQELSFTSEFSFLDYKTGSIHHRFTPFIFAGLSVFHFNPKTEITDNNNEIMTLNLHDMHTEGLGIIDGTDNYKLWQISIPFGIGLKFSVNKYICLGLEWGFRKTFTDYLDDISSVYADRQQLLYNVNEYAVSVSDRTHELDNHAGEYHKQGGMRGNSTTDDWYNFFGITITTKLSSGNNKCLKH